MMSPQTTRHHHICGVFGKATIVVTITIGLSIGAPSRKLTLAPEPTPEVKKRLATGTFPHSHTGKNIPTKLITVFFPRRFFGSIFWSQSGVRYLPSIAETILPNRIKGVASMMIPRKTLKASNKSVINMQGIIHKTCVYAKKTCIIKIPILCFCSGLCFT